MFVSMRKEKKDDKTDKDHYIQNQDLGPVLEWLRHQVFALVLGES
jgi:hypothetical protein